MIELDEPQEARIMALVTKYDDGRHGIETIVREAVALGYALKEEELRESSEHSGSPGGLIVIEAPKFTGPTGDDRPAFLRKIMD